MSTTPSTSPAASPASVKIYPPNHLMGGLLGQRDELLRAVEDAFPSVTILVRGNEISIEGEDATRVGRLFDELVVLLQRGHDLDRSNVGRTIDMVKADERPSEVLTSEILRSARGRTVRPKTSGQKRYVDAIQNNVVTFGIGPAGTGKSYLAVAMAVGALQRKECERIILTRPAVEAGERLGFLPGDLMAKVDPYLRPLYDALFDMLGTDAVPRLMEKGAIEIAPLAYMRGRAQPVDTPVLTPDGFRSIGSLRVGDLVIGRHGLPTHVLGVYPQGVKDVYEVRTQDGGRTQACAEHLWSVRTEAAAVLKTREIARGLRAGRRFELPLVRAAEFAAPEQAHASSGGVALRAAPTVAGSVVARIACLQDVLDREGEPVRRRDGGYSVLWSSSSEAERDEIVFVVRSLGGVALETARGAIDIRLPAGVRPFRSPPKALRYDAREGGRPMRFIDSIEPAGRAECVCIAVAAQDSLYVTSDFIVTHNTLNGSFIILDEAQNTTPEQMKMFLTRIGFGSKAVVTGDVTQIDLEGGKSGLVNIEQVLSGVEDMEFVHLSGKDVVRHKIVQDIVDAYEQARARGLKP